MTSAMASEVTYNLARPPCPTEERCIIRHAYRYYNNIIVAAVYKLSPRIDHLRACALATYVPALRACLEAHAFLSTTLVETGKQKRDYARISHVDLTTHFRIIKPETDLAVLNNDGVSENELLARAMEFIHNDPNLTFFDTATISPAWRVDLLRLEPADQQQRVWISFTYAHHIGDGMSGLIFHDTFSKALASATPRATQEMSSTYQTTEAELAMLPKLPLSPWYLLTPALGHYLPTFLSKIFGLRASVSGSGPDTWKGRDTFLNSKSSTPPITTAVEILALDNTTLSNVLSACRRHDTKLTSLLNELIALCMSRQLCNSSLLTAKHTNLVSASATNIRKLCGVPDNTMGAFASVGYSLHEIDRSSATFDEITTINDKVWSAARVNSAELARSVSVLRDQPIGLLSWISDLDSWMKEQMDKPRDASWLVSNLLTFDGAVPEPCDVEVEKMFFCSPADGVGAPLDFNIVSVRGGELSICAGWQVGAIGLSERGSNDSRVVVLERAFVRDVLRGLRRYLEVAAQ